VTEIINTIVVPIVRRDRALTALRTLEACTPHNYKVVAVDQTKPDEGADDPWHFTKALWDLAADVVVKPSLNMGFAQASNLGIDMARTEYVTVLNDDVEFIEGHDWWGGVMETFERFPEAAAVNPQSPKEPGWGWAEPGYRYHVPKDWPDEELREYGRRDRELQKAFREARLGAHEARQRGEPDPALEDREASLRREMLEHRAEFEPRVYEAALSDPVYVESLTQDMNWAVIDGFPCWLVVFKREPLVEEIGLFDERYFPGGGEDYDMMHRIYRAGYRGLATSRAWAWHWWGQSKDEPGGKAQALPPARDPWNKLSTKCDPDEGMYEPDCDVWAKRGHRTDEIIYRAPL